MIKTMVIKKLVFSIFLLFLLISCTPKNSQKVVDPDSCAKLYQQKQYTKAMQSCEREAMNGNNKAQYLLARLYLEASERDGVTGYSCWNDYSQQGLFWLKESAQNDYVPAELTLGNLYIYLDAEFLWSTRGLLRGGNEAGAYWYERAAKQGDAEGQFNLGDYYMGAGYPWGKGTDYASMPSNPIRDCQKALYWYTKSAVQGYQQAAERLEEKFYSKCNNKINKK